MVTMQRVNVAAMSCKPRRQRMLRHIAICALGAISPWLLSLNESCVYATQKSDPEKPAALGEDDLTDEHVQLAIRAMVQELYARRDTAKFWEPNRYDSSVDAGQAGGFTALAVLALLYAGESYQEPRLREAVTYLENLGLNGTYAAGVRAHVWAMLPDRFRKQLELDARWLTEGFSEHARGWNYGKEPQTTRRDNSVTQYGALGLWESSKRGVKINARLWQMLEERFIAMQVADGGWNYDGSGETTGSMTTAGLAVLFITQDFLHSDRYLGVGSTSPSAADQAIKLGMAWMDANFSATENPGRDTDFYYYLYGVERVGLASGYKYFGGRDWYRAGAAELIRRLCRWDPQQRTMSIHSTIAGNARAGAVRTVDLCFALMFLSRGRVPVAINKLRSDSLAWNNRPRDVANLTTWISTRAESMLNWQIVDHAADPREWLEAPLLYLASHQALPWTKDSPELLKLREYLLYGGMILAVNEGAGNAFAHSVEQLGSALFPELAWRDLPPDHPAFTMLWPVRDKRPKLRGLSNGLRELIVLCPTDDLAHTFQRRADDRTAHFEAAANLYLYASEMNRPRPRLAQHAPNVIDTAPARATITVARASHAGRWNPEPKALTHFQWAMAERDIAILLQEHPLAEIHLAQPPPALVIVSGIDSHTFSDAEQAAVQAFVASGGTVLFETAGGRGAFAVSAEAMAAARFVKPIRALLRGPIITGEGLSKGTSVASVEYRSFSFEHFGSRETAPRLRAMTIDNEPRLLFSREDISHALLDQPCWGVSGYSPDSVLRLLGNIAQHAQLLRDAHAAATKND